MHPLAHMMAGALIGQLVGHPAAALGGGLASHALLDVIPHTEGRTFKAEGSPRGRLVSPEHLEAGVEFVAAALAIAWITRCPAADGRLIALAALAAILPDIVDQPLERLRGIRLLHVRRWHWTVARRHALWGILTQLVIAGGAGLALLKLTGCV